MSMNTNYAYKIAQRLKKQTEKEPNRMVTEESNTSVTLQNSNLLRLQLQVIRTVNDKTMILQKKKKKSQKSTIRTNPTANRNRKTVNNAREHLKEKLRR